MNAIKLEDYLNNPLGFSDEELKVMKELPIEPAEFKIDGHKKETLFENIEKFYNLAGYILFEGEINQTYHLKNTKDETKAIFSFVPLQMSDSALVKVILCNF